MTRGQRHLLLFSAAPILAVALVGLDYLVDPDVSGVGELVVDVIEKTLLVGAMIAVALMVVKVNAVARDTRELKGDIATARLESAAWRARSRKLLASLSEAIQDQFEEWNLTPAEADIAGLMLKGLSLKDIAALRDTSEATIRQQAQGVYRKSGLSNRAQVAAYFLEDLYDVVGSQREETDAPGAPMN